MDEHTIQKTMEATGAGRDIVIASLGFDDQRIAAETNATIAIQEVSRICGGNRELYSEVEAALSRDWGVALGDPQTLLKVFGSVEGVCVKVPYIVGYIKSRVMKEKTDSGREKRLAERKYVYNMRLAGSKVIGSVSDDVASGNMPEWDKLIRDYVTILFENKVNVETLDIKLRCSLDAFRFFMGEGKVMGDVSVEENMFEIDV